MERRLCWHILKLHSTICWALRWIHCFCRSIWNMGTFDKELLCIGRALKCRWTYTEVGSFFSKSVRASRDGWIFLKSSSLRPAPLSSFSKHSPNFLVRESMSRSRGPSPAITEDVVWWGETNKKLWSNHDFLEFEIEFMRWNMGSLWRLIGFITYRDEDRSSEKYNDEFHFDDLDFNYFFEHEMLSTNNWWLRWALHGLLYRNLLHRTSSYREWISYQRIYGLRKSHSHYINQTPEH